MRSQAVGKANRGKRFEQETEATGLNWNGPCLLGERPVLLLREVSSVHVDAIISMYDLLHSAASGLRFRRKKPS